MDQDASRERARHAAERLAGASAPAGSRLLEPLPVLSPHGDVESWFVPVASGDELAGYVRVGAGGPSWSSFGTRPSAASWTDAEFVLRVAAAAGFDVDDAGDPYLGYDGVPPRLAWVVPLRDGGVAYVAGESAWR